MILSFHISNVYVDYAIDISYSQHVFTFYCMQNSLLGTVGQIRNRRYMSLLLGN